MGAICNQVLPPCFYRLLALTKRTASPPKQSPAGTRGSSASLLSRLLVTLRKRIVVGGHVLQLAQPVLMSLAAPARFKAAELGCEYGNNSDAACLFSAKGASRFTQCADDKGPHERAARSDHIYPIWQIALYRLGAREMRRTAIAFRHSLSGTRAAMVLTEKSAAMRLRMTFGRSARREGATVAVSALARGASMMLLAVPNKDLASPNERSLFTSAGMPPRSAADLEVSH
jgi:hypothetical protein